MDINSIYGSSASPLLDSVYGEKSKSEAAEEKSNGVASWGEDIISISTAAREKLAAMSGDSPESEENAQKEDEAAAGQAGAAGGGGGSSSDNEAKITGLKSKLANLQASLGKAEGAEEAQINAQIGQVMAEIAALEAETA